MIFIGHGVTLAEASKELTEFVHRLQIPVISSPNGMGCLDMTDPLSLGFIGRNGAYPANEAGRRADVVIAIGARFDDRSASSWMPGYSWNFPHDQADPRRRRPGRARPQLSARSRHPGRRAHLPAPTAGRARAPRCQARRRARHGIADIEKWKAEWDKFTRPNFDIHATPIRPERIVADCQAVLPDDAILACDVGVNHNWYMQFWKARRPQTMLNSWGFSGMGFGAAGALGAKLAAPDRPVVAIAGDGCFTMVPHVLCTAVEYNIPVVWVIWNNFGWVSIRDIQLGMFGGRELGTMFHQGANKKPYNPDFAGWAKCERRRCPDGHQVGGLQGRARARGQVQQAVPARRACRRRVRPPATGAWQLPPTPYKEPVFGKRLAVARRRRPVKDARAKERDDARAWFIRNIAEVPWREFPNHFGGALSKPLVMPETAGAQHIDYRISMYQPMAYVENCTSTRCRSRSITCSRARA